MTTVVPTPVRSGLRTGSHGWLKSLVAKYVRRRWDLHVRGQENIPEDGPVIIASNHVGWLDGPVTVITAPRPVFALTKRESFEGRSGLLLRLAHQIPLDRRRTDTAAIRTALRVLRAGQMLLVYPEGVRGAGEMEQTKPGVAWLAMVTGAPIVPLALFGTREPGADVESKPAKGARIDIVYGRPLYLDPVPWPRDTASVRKEQLRVTEELQGHVAWAKSALSRDLPGPPPRWDKTDERT